VRVSSRRHRLARVQGEARRRQRERAPQRHEARSALRRSIAAGLRSGFGETPHGERFASLRSLAWKQTCRPPARTEPSSPTGRVASMPPAIRRAWTPTVSSTIHARVVFSAQRYGNHHSEFGRAGSVGVTHSRAIDATKSRELPSSSFIIAVLRRHLSPREQRCELRAQSKARLNTHQLRVLRDEQIQSVQRLDSAPFMIAATLGHAATIR